MNIILFLGSGVSFQSGLPTTEILTKKILKPTENFTVSFLNILHDFDRDHSSLGLNQELYRNSTTYEDLYYLCEEMSYFDWGIHNNPMVPAFIEVLSKKLGEKLSITSNPASLAHSAKSYIRDSILDSLNQNVEIVGLDLILNLSKCPFVDSLNIITLNHDNLVESLLDKNKIEYEDGFSELDGDFRWFAPDKFFATTKVKIIKLHGSIDWYSYQSESGEKVAKISIDSNTPKRNASGIVVNPFDKSPKLITGINKISFYNSGIYTDIHYHFQKVLYENDLMIMSGYGWGDDPINNRIMTWLDRKDDRKLLLLHKNELKELMDRSLVFDRDHSNWINFGKLEVIKKWLSETQLDEVMDKLK